MEIRRMWRLSRSSFLNSGHVRNAGPPAVWDMLFASLVRDWSSVVPIEAAQFEYMRVVLNSFIWKTSSSPKFFFLSPNFRELHVFLSRYMLAKIFKKNVDAWYPQIVPGVWSLVTLHSAATALKHLRSALRCWSLLTFIGQFWHNKSTV